MILTYPKQHDKARWVTRNIFRTIAIVCLDCWENFAADYQIMRLDTELYVATPIHRDSQFSITGLVCEDAVYYVRDKFFDDFELSFIYNAS